MSSPRHLSWENFRATVFLHGQQRVHRISDSPFVEIFGDGVLNRIGIWLETESGTPIPPELSKLAFITTRTFEDKDRTLLEVATATDSLQREFYHFAAAVAERVTVDKRSAIDAVSLELLCFTDLLQEKSILGPERQIGLLGELLFLERLMEKNGTSALDAWLGPISEPHDFRIDGTEFEVKTTVSPHRIHTIHGTEQVVPSNGCSLYLVSVLLGPAGASTGFSLSEKFEQLSVRLGLEPLRLNQFNTALERCGFRRAECAHYGRRFAMRRPLGLVPLDSDFPAITRPKLQVALGPVASRVESLQYDVNVEGLEHDDGTTEFAAVIPS
jgi:hypothetical protein